MNQNQLREALEIAVRQNEHDMLMTGDELRKARAILSQPAQEGADRKLIARLDGLAAWLRNPANANGCEALELSFRIWCEELGQALTALRATPPASQEQADDTRRCIDARNRLNAAIHGDGAVIDDLETAVHQACLIIKRHRASQDQAQQSTDTVQLFGVRNGMETLLGTAKMPARMKARDLAREQFGHFEDGDGSDAELCFAALEQLIEHMAQQPTPAAVPGPQCRDCADFGPICPNSGKPCGAHNITKD